MEEEAEFQDVKKSKATKSEVRDYMGTSISRESVKVSGGDFISVKHKKKKVKKPEKPESISEESKKKKKNEKQKSVAVEPAEGNKKDENCESGCTKAFRYVSLAHEYFVMFVLFPILPIIALYKIRKDHVAMIYYNGKLIEQRNGPSWYFKKPGQTISKVNCELTKTKVVIRNALTKDKAIISVHLEITYQIFDPLLVIKSLENPSRTVTLVVETATRNALITKYAIDIITNRVSICNETLEYMEHLTEKWGVTIDRVEILKVVYPDIVQRAVDEGEKANKTCQQKMDAAEREKEFSESLVSLADKIKGVPQALNVRYLHTLMNIAAEKNSTVIVPVPIEPMKKQPAWTAHTLS